MYQHSLLSLLFFLPPNVRWSTPILVTLRTRQLRKCKIFSRREDISGRGGKDSRYWDQLSPTKVLWETEGTQQDWEEAPASDSRRSEQSELIQLFTRGGCSIRHSRLRLSSSLLHVPALRSWPLRTKDSPWHSTELLGAGTHNP